MTIITLVLSLTVYEIFAKQKKIQKFDHENEGQCQGDEKLELRHSSGNVRFYIGDTSEF